MAGWFAAWQAERQAQQEAEYIIHKTDVKCPECQAACRVLAVKKEGKNHGRPFISCRGCQTFVWLDEPRCPTCGLNTYRFRTKGASRRLMEACPRKCFAPRWLD